MSREMMLPGAAEMEINAALTRAVERAGGYAAPIMDRPMTRLQPQPVAGICIARLRAENEAAHSRLPNSRKVDARMRQIHTAANSLNVAFAYVPGEFWDRVHPDILGLILDLGMEADDFLQRKGAYSKRQDEPQRRQGRPHNIVAREVARAVCEVYRVLSGKRPTMTVDPISAEARGIVLDLLREIFEAFEIEASPEAALKQAIRTRRASGRG